jgi:uncharacterized ParB-like nuclease family protein
MPQYQAPGVYVEEVDAGPVPIQGVTAFSRSTGDAVQKCVHPGCRRFRQIDRAQRETMGAARVDH